MKKQAIYETEKIYDGRVYCGVGACPVVEFSKKQGVVKIHDPAKPHMGTFTMTAEEYNTLIKNAPTVEEA